MTLSDPGGGVLPLDTAPPELSYPGLSPQLLARVKQLWSASGLDFDRAWRLGLRPLPGFRPVPRMELAANSAGVDLVFLFDQCLLWVRALHAAAHAGHGHQVAGLSAAQWQGLAGLTARLTDQLAALRLLALTGLPMPAMQIARSVSEDADMALVLLVRPKLAQTFADCRNVEEASDFWRRHIAGGRAFKTVSERLYAVGIDHSADTEYAGWRRQVLATLGAAVHSNALQTRLPETRSPDSLLNDDSLYFATFRVHELCAFAQLIEPAFTDLLIEAGAAARTEGAGGLAALAAPMNAIVVNQLHSLTAPEPPQARATARH
ncbi:hypothetical protein [Pararhodobacter sp.]|uniref:hypothetical protein n=1 Tax=Pararhodobacter sp. TaxID=2127056 RepID=UPI002AFF70D6|nr:hypothetical protein [Pararhodobacter sp.]